MNFSFDLEKMEVPKELEVSKTASQNMFRHVKLKK